MKRLKRLKRYTVGAVLVSAATGWLYVSEHVSGFLSWGPDWATLGSGIYGGWPVSFLEYRVDLIAGEVGLRPGRFYLLGPPDLDYTGLELHWELFGINAAVWLAAAAAFSLLRAAYVRTREFVA